MGGIFSREKPTDPNDYEKVLSELDEKIQKVEVRLSDIKIRQRRTGALWLFYSTLLWSVYLAYCFLTVNSNDIPTDIMLIQFLPVIVLPIAIYYMRKALTWFYARKQSSEEKNLTELRSQQKQKVEELKKKTSYYTTQSLLERYDLEALAKKKQQQQLQQHQDQLRQRKPVSMPAPGTRMIPPTQQSSSQHPQMGNNNMNNNNNRGMPLPPTQNGMLNPQQMVSQTSVTRGPPQWYDKVIDALIGEDGPETKYALICHHCYAHNGLILPSEVDTIQYVCPVCKKFNPSRRSRQLHPDGPVLPPPRTPSPAPSLTLSNDKIKMDTINTTTANNEHNNNNNNNFDNNNDNDNKDNENDNNGYIIDNENENNDENENEGGSIADRVRRRHVKETSVQEDDDEDKTIEN